MALRKGAGVSELCREGDELLGEGEPERATALYVAAFGRHAGSTLSHVRGLGAARLAGVISTLEAWLDGRGDASGAGEGLNKGLAAVFLSTLSPNNLAASLYKMESVLLGGGQCCEEVAVRCSALLDGNGVPQVEGSARLTLELTRALACLLSQPHSPTGPLLYLRAFRENEVETGRLLKSRQALHLPRIVKAFLQYLVQLTPASQGENEAREGARPSGPPDPAPSSECMRFLASVCPEDTRVQEVRAAMLLHKGRFEESAEAYSRALQGGGVWTETPPVAEKTAPDSLPPERKACLLVGRAAASFMAGGRATEACRDLGQAFEIHPAAARLHFQRLFSDSGTAQAARAQLRQQAERALSEHREAVLARPDLRSSVGAEQLDPVIAQLRALCHLEPGGGSRELRVRLADCLLLRGEFKEALSICSQLAAAASPAGQSYQNTVHVLRGYARLLSDDHQGAAEDFQAVIEHSAPHPSSCVRALCGRGLLRMLAGSPYLTALDYVTASRLQPQDAALTVRCLVPWNRRGLLCTVLLEQGRVMLEGPQNQDPAPGSPLQQGHQPPPTQGRESCSTNKEETAVGVHALAVLLAELEPGADGPQILAADSLYCLGRVEEAHRLLLSIGKSSPRSPVLARLAMLQLHRGFLYDANQLLKKLTQCGDTSCLRPLLTVASPEDRALLQRHCHAAASRILESQREDAGVREAVAYLSIAIMASGGEATESLLARARCYVLLGQRKTAIFDFSAILKEHTEHVQALCGRGFTYLMLNQQKFSSGALEEHTCSIGISLEE
ncbi:tetratricopeptide repeat protein 34 isoform X1 [Anguilla anguilla]|uniref:tetratricopeptide repeat protein 34 isoform X1 n=1 Tax=Anguilla anguilla TaxID=7936 RepID=UPI0015B20CFA|nr:tetratricopeptide repeat protein 34 isoform X1 [Anguilla anguilla]